MDRRRFLLTSLAGALAAPRTAATQGAGKGARIGYLIANAERGPLDDAFDQALRGLGWIEGRNITVQRRYLAGRMDQARAAAQDLAGLNLDVIVVWSPPLTSAVKATGTKTAVVFLAGSAAVELGFAASLARPGGTMTGIAFQPIDTLLPKYMEIAKELAPHATRFALLVAPGETAHRIPEASDRAAQTFKIRLQRVVAGTPEELSSALEAIGHGDAQVLVVPPSALVYVHRKQVIAFAERRRLPGVYCFREVTAEGGLASFSANLSEIASHGATYVDKILKGARPGELPIEQPTRYDLVINLKTAKALGLTIPPSLLARADQIIDP
jgi:putative tryptophan/tyrosine transport system substrate-binding protein